MRIVSWNVNGLRACARRGFGAFLKGSGAGVVAVQEVRARPEQLPREVRSPPGWHARFVAAERPGYSGVGIYSRAEPVAIEDALGCPRFDPEGRFLLAVLEPGPGPGRGRPRRLAVASVYFPKGSGRERDNSRVGYKLAFYAAVFARLERLRRRMPVLVAGDFNTAHREIDLARPRDNVRNSGFLPEERAELDRWTAAGWVDTFRALHPDEPGHYTWWRQWGGARARNVGWRIDYVLASPAAMRRVRDAFVWPAVTGSDHCPVGVEIDA